MKILKYLLFLILIIFIAGSIYVATKDGHFEVASSKVIAAPAPLLFREVADYNNWEDWESWTNIKGMNMNINKASGEDAELFWEAEGIRDGQIITTSEIPYSIIEQYLVMQTTLGESGGEVTWLFEPQGDSTRVSWTLQGDQSFKEKLAFSLQDNDLSDVFFPIFENSLENLEQNVIRKMEEYSISVDGVTEHGGGYYMYSTTAARFGEVNARAADMIEQLGVYMEDNNISNSGKPFVIYNQRDERNGTTIFSAAVPTSSQVITPSGSAVLNGYLEPQKVVKATLKGSRKNAAETWERVYRYIEENGLQVNPQGQPFEIYITNPVEVDNPALYVTEVYIPVL